MTRKWWYIVSSLLVLAGACAPAEQAVVTDASVDSPAVEAGWDAGLPEVAAMDAIDAVEPGDALEVTHGVDAAPPHPSSETVVEPAPDGFEDLRGDIEMLRLLIEGRKAEGSDPAALLGVDVMDGDAVASRLVTRRLAFDAVRDAFIALVDGSGAINPVVIGQGPVEGQTFSIKSGVARPQRITGMKVGSYWPGAEDHGLPRHGSSTLLLNPDTVVEEDTFLKCIDFMDTHPDAGALGVKMIDGKGKFLPESKRSLPTPEVAFYKMCGLSSLFPRSRRFGKYNLAYLDPDSTHIVDVLAGAFMFLRKDTR